MPENALPAISTLAWTASTPVLSAFTPALSAFTLAWTIFTPALAASALAYAASTRAQSLPLAVLTCCQLPAPAKYPSAVSVSVAR